MGTVGRAAKIKDGDWTSVRQAIAKLSIKGGPTSSPTYTGLTLTGLSASRLLASDADKLLVSSDLASWVIGTTNQIIVTDDNDGSVTLSTPQDIHIGASPTFAGLNITGGGVIDASIGEVLVSDNDTDEPKDKDDGYIGVAIIGGQPRIYFTVDGDMYYVEGSASAVIGTGSPIGLLLCLTYNLE